MPALDLEIEGSEPPSAPQAAAKPGPASDVPVIEIPEEPPPPPKVDLDAPSGKGERERVISSNQLADIRKKMQEKMAAAKAKAG